MNSRPILRGCFSRHALGSVLSAVASVLLLGALWLPLWHIRLEAPQYRGPDALRVAVYPGEFRGDLRELTVLQQYIGVHIPKTLPQFKWLPDVLVAAAVFGFVAGFLPRRTRRFGMILVAPALAVALSFAAARAIIQIHDIGHQRDEKTVLVGIKDFTPPFIGSAKIAQFTVTSWFGLGAWFIGVALVSQSAAAWLTAEKKAPAAKSSPAIVSTNSSARFVV